jgi:hypothetical protein
MMKKVAFFYSPVRPLPLWQNYYANESGQHIFFLSDSQGESLDCGAPAPL